MNEYILIVDCKWVINTDNKIESSAYIKIAKLNKSMWRLWTLSWMTCMAWSTSHPSRYICRNVHQRNICHGKTHDSASSSKRCVVLCCVVLCYVVLCCVVSPIWITSLCISQPPSGECLILLSLWRMHYTSPQATLYYNHTYQLFRYIIFNTWKLRK